MNERECAMLRVLAALAWADGVVTPAESAMLDRMADEFGLSPEDRASCVTLRGEPVPLDRFEELVRDLRALVPSPEERRQMLARAHRLVAADDAIAPEESRWLRSLERILEAEEAPSFFARVRAAFAVPVRPAGNRGAMPREEAERRVLGGLLTRRILQAGGVRDTASLEAAASRFLVAKGTAEGEAGPLLATIRRNAAAEEDRQRLCASVNRITDHDGRLEVLGALFAAVGPSAVRSPEMEAELRRIANFLWIEPQEYVSLRAAAGGSGPGLGLAPGLSS